MNQDNRRRRTIWIAVLSVAGLFLMLFVATLDGRQSGRRPAEGAALEDGEPESGTSDASLGTFADSAGEDRPRDGQESEDLVMPPRERQMSETAGGDVYSVDSVADEEAIHGALRGRVLDADTRLPVASASITFAAMRSEITGRPGPGRSVTSDREGMFEFQPSRTGTYAVAVVEAEGYRPYAPEWGESSLLFASTPGRRLQGLTIYLSRSEVIDVLVLNEEGRRASNATLRCFGGDALQRRLVPIACDAITNAEGRAEIEAVPGTVVEAELRIGSRGGQRADKRGRAMVTHAAIARGHLEITLRDARRDPGVIAGHVEFTDGSFDAWGITVVAEPRSNNPALVGEDLLAGAAAVTDTMGRFRIEGLDMRDYMLRIERTAGEGDGVVARVGPLPAGTLDAVVRLSPGGSLEGRVSEVSGEAFSSFSVTVLERDGIRAEVMAHRAFIGAQGAFFIGGLQPGTYDVVIAARGYAPRVLENVSVVEADRVDLGTVTMRLGGSLSGRVTSEVDGAPIQGAEVSLEGSPADAPLVPRLAGVRTSADGRFDIRGVAPGRRSLVVQAPGFHRVLRSGIVVREGTPPQGGNEPITITLRPALEDEEAALEMVGIGAVLAAGVDRLLVGQVVEGGGAHAAGLQAGDELLALDGVPVSSMTFANAIERIRGPEGSVIQIVVFRAGRDESSGVEISVMRRRIQVGE